MSFLKKIVATITLVTVIISNAHSAKQIHVKIEIYFDQALLANPTLIVEENKLSKMNMNIPGFQNYDLKLILKKQDGKLHADLRFKSDKFEIVEEFIVEIDEENKMKFGDYLVVIKPKYLD